MQGGLERARTALTRARSLAHASGDMTVVRIEDLSARVEWGLGNLQAARDGFTVVVKPVHDLIARTERDVRSRIGPDQWALAYAAGRTTSIDALLKDIEGVVRMG